MTEVRIEITPDFLEKCATGTLLGTLAAYPSDEPQNMEAIHRFVTHLNKVIAEETKLV